MLIALTLALSFAVAEPAATNPADDYADQVKLATADRISEIPKEIADLQKTLKRGGSNPRKRQAMVDKVKSLRAELKELKAGKQVVPVLTPPFVPGNIGKPFTDQAIVLNISGPEEMMVEMGHRAVSAGRILPPTVRTRSCVGRPRPR